MSTSKPTRLAPIRELGEAINSLRDNLWDWNRETLERHVGELASEYIRTRDAHDDMIEALRRIANGVPVTESIQKMARAAIELGKRLTEQRQRTETDARHEHANDATALVRVERSIARRSEDFGAAWRHAHTTHRFSNGRSASTRDATAREHGAAAARDIGLSGNGKALGGRPVAHKRIGGAS